MLAYLVPALPVAEVVLHEGRVVSTHVPDECLEESVKAPGESFPDAPVVVEADHGVPGVSADVDDPCGGAEEPDGQQLQCEMGFYQSGRHKLLNLQGEC